MSDIFREVDEALSREKAAAFWKNYGPTLIACAIIIVATTAATTGYLRWTSWNNKNETAKLVAATNDPDIAAAMEKAAADTDGAHKAVAQMIAAAKQAESKDFTAAAQTYQSVADDSGAPDDLRDLAVILNTRAATLAAADKAPDYKAMAEKLVPIANNPESAFRHQAKLEAALLYGDGLKDYTRALDLLKDFDSDAPSDSLKETATALSPVYQYELAQSPAKAAKPE